MNPELSRRMARAMTINGIDFPTRFRFAREVMAANSFYELSKEAQEFIALAELSAKSVVLKFNPDQPRDENGRFAETDGTSSADSLFDGLELGSSNTLEERNAHFEKIRDIKMPLVDRTVSKIVQSDVSTKDFYRTLSYQERVDEIFLAEEKWARGELVKPSEIQLLSEKFDGKESRSIHFEPASWALEELGLSASTEYSREQIEQAISQNGKSDYFALPESNEAREQIATRFADYMVGEWNGSTSSSESIIILEEAARRVFDLDGEQPQTPVSQRVLSQYEEKGKPYEALLRAQHETTQEYFAEKGISSVELYRGLHIYSKDSQVPSGVVAESQIKSGSLDSWSSDFSAAKIFANKSGVSDSSTILKTVVPVENVASFALSGMGDVSESEFILIGNGIRAEAAHSTTAEESWR